MASPPGIIATGTTLAVTGGPSDSLFVRGIGLAMAGIGVLFVGWLIRRQQREARIVID